MTDPTRNLIGGRYEVIVPLGKGGMGVVYKAYDPVLDRTVAIKKMAPSVVDHDEFRQRFFTEARAVARLNHPNIVTIHELEEDEGGIYIVMELLDGVSLSAVMKHEAKLSRDTQVTILSKVCSGLDYAHVRGIVHRDIKPANLVLTTTGGVKILDFGIARFATSERISLGGTMLGTPHYMSPEQIEGKPVDARADWFSFGAVAYELIAGRKPFDAPSVPPLLMKITGEPHVPLIDVVPDTVPPLSAIVDKLLAKDREQRCSSGADVQCALDASGDTNREDLIADVVRRVMGDAAVETIVQPISRVVPGPLIAAKPTTPLGIPNVTPSSTTPASRTPATIGSTQVGIPPLPTVPITPAAPVTPIAPAATATPSQPTPAASAASAGGVPQMTTPIAAPVASTASAASPAAPATGTQPMPSGIPAARSSLRGALLVVGLLLLVIGLSGAGVMWWWVTSTDSGRFALSMLRGRQTSPASTTSPSTSSTSMSSSSTQPRQGSATPSDSSSTAAANTPTETKPVETKPAETTTPAETTPTADASSPSTQTPAQPVTSTPPSTSSTAPASPRDTATTRTADTSTRSATEPRSTTPPPRETTTARADTSTRVTSEPRSTTAPPRGESSRHTTSGTPTAAPPEPPHGRGLSEPPPPDDAPRVASRSSRVPLDESTISAFKGSRDSSSTPAGYGAIDSPMLAASVVRIKDTLETYSQSIEHQDLETLRSVREPLTAAESAQAQSASPTVVRFTEVDVRTDGRTAAVRARRAISVGGAVKSNGSVEIRLTRRPSGWVITDIR